MALLEVCSTENTPANTGTVCEASMAAPAMIIAVDPSLTWTETAFANFYDYCLQQIHLKKMFPLVGSIASVTSSDENDITQTFDNGVQVYVRPGVYNWLFSSPKGGNCLAAALATFNGRKFSFIEVDIEGKVSFRKNADGTFAGFKVNEMYSPKPTKATFSTVAMVNLFISVSPREYIQNGTIRKSEEDLTDLAGLIDALLVAGVTPNTTTKLHAGIISECSKRDLLGRLGAAITDPSNFIVIDGTGTVLSHTVAIVNNELEFTVAAQTVGETITIQAVSPALLFANDVEGVEIANTLNVTIPN